MECWRMETTNHCAKKNNSDGACDHYSIATQLGVTINCELQKITEVLISGKSTIIKWKKK